MCSSSLRLHMHAGSLKMRMHPVSAAAQAGCSMGTELQYDTHGTAVYCPLSPAAGYILYSSYSFVGLVLSVHFLYSSPSLDQLSRFTQ